MTYLLNIIPPVDDISTTSTVRVPLNSFNPLGKYTNASCLNFICDPDRNVSSGILLVLISGPPFITSKVSVIDTLSSNIASFFMVILPLNVASLSKDVCAPNVVSPKKLLTSGFDECCTKFCPVIVPCTFKLTRRSVSKSSLPIVI